MDKREWRHECCVVMSQKYNAEETEAEKDK